MKTKIDHIKLKLTKKQTEYVYRHITKYGKTNNWVIIPKTSKNSKKLYAVFLTHETILLLKNEAIWEIK